MRKNMGTIDRVLRVVIAVVIAVLYFSNTVGGTPGIVLLIIAAIFLLTSFISVCPLYIPLGLNTRKKKS